MINEMNPSLNLSDIALSDIPAIYTIEKLSFHRTWKLEQLRHELDLFGVWARKMRWKDLIIGYYFANLVAGEASLNRIAVDPRFRGIGIGKNLLDDFIGRARGNGAEQAFLEVDIKNENALSLYQEASFMRVGKRPAYYEDGSDALIMRLDFLDSGQDGEIGIDLRNTNQNKLRINQDPAKEFINDLKEAGHAYPGN